MPIAGTEPHRHAVLLGDEHVVELRQDGVGRVEVVGIREVGNAASQIDRFRDGAEADVQHAVTCRTAISRSASVCSMHSAS